MLAVLLTEAPKNPCIEVGDVREPGNEAGRIVVEVACAGITRMEPHWSTSWQNANGTPRQQPVPLGLEFSGRVRSSGPGAHGFTAGQNVLGMVDPFRGGAMAEFVSTEADRIMPMPEGLSFEEAAALALAGLTAWQGLVRHGELTRGQRVLIHGGAGGVGSFATQIAYWIGAHVTVTASAEDAALCSSLGAEVVIDFSQERFEDRGETYHLVFDQIGGEVLERSWAVLKRGGKLITIAGEEAGAPDQERARLLGVSARYFIFEYNRDDLRRLIDLVVAGQVRVVVGKRIDLAAATTAFVDRAERFAGKAVLVCSDIVPLKEPQLFPAA